MQMRTSGGPVFGLLLSMALLFGCGRSREWENADLLIRHINVVDVNTGILLPDQVIAIKDGRITHLGADPGRVDASSNTRVIDGSGRYAIPGLWDMHVHVCWSETNASLLLPALLASGITGVRDMGGDLRLLNAFKQRVLTDPSAGPDLFGCGPIIDGDPPVFPEFTLPTDSATDLPKVLDSLAANGADFFKVYSLMRPSELERIAAYCRSHHVVFAGHLSEFMEPEGAIALGQHSIEHLNRLEEIWVADSARLDKLASAMIEHGTWSCPTLIIYQRKSHLFDPTLRDTAMDALVPELQAEWAHAVRKRTELYGTPQQRDSLERRYQQQLQLVRHLHKRGVRMMVGSDLAGMAFVYPGTGLLEELELLTEAGLSNAEVLRCATLAPAEYLGVNEDRGSIAIGKLADLVILNADPLTDIRHVRRIAHVVHRGVVIPRTR